MNKIYNFILVILYCFDLIVFIIFPIFLKFKFLIDLNNKILKNILVLKSYIHTFSISKIYFSQHL